MSSAQENNVDHISDDAVVEFADATTEFIAGLIEPELLLRDPSPDNKGIFYPMKSTLLVEGANSAEENGRCDNLTYTLVSPLLGTEYEGDGLSLGKKIPYTDEVFAPTDLGRIVFFSEVPGVFGFGYLTIRREELESGPWAHSLNVARTMGEMFKIIYEWSVLAGEPFNSTHPVALLAKDIMDFLKPPKKIVDEIVSYPDMHVARFLQGDPNHRDRVEDFPAMSAAMKQWVVSIVEKYPKSQFNKLISDL